MNSLVKICVPSKARAEIFIKKTAKILQHTNVDWSVFVEPQDVGSYLEAGVEEGRLVVLKHNDQGLGHALSAMKKHCQSSGVEFVWKMDDDIHHWYDHSRVSSKSDQGKMLDDCLTLLSDLSSVTEEAGLSLGGLSFPSKYFHSDWRDVTHVNKMFETTYIVRTESWFVPEVTRGYHEEFVASAHLLLEELVTLRIGKYCWAADLSTLPGGLQSFDRATEQREFYDLLQKEYPRLSRQTDRIQYTQKTGTVFEVTSKPVFNRRFSTKLKTTTSSPGFLKEVAECQRKSVSALLG